MATMNSKDSEQQTKVVQLERELALAKGQMKRMRALNRELRAELRDKEMSAEEQAEETDNLRQAIAMAEREQKRYKSMVRHLQSLLTVTRKSNNALLKDRNALIKDCIALRKTEKELTEKLREAEQNARYFEELAARYRSILNNNSRNSSKPSSTDQKKSADAPDAENDAPADENKPANSYNGRKPTDRKPGGQKGHPGKTLDKEDARNMCQRPNARCRTIVTAPRGKSSKYVVDLDVKVDVAEYIAGKAKNSSQKTNVVYGPNIRAVAVYLYAEGQMSIRKISDFYSMMTDGALQISTGTIYNFLQSFDKNAQASIDDLNADLLPTSVVYTDSTNVALDGKQAYVRNFSTAQTVVYYPQLSKSLEALHGIPLLEAFLGTLVHDHETAMYHFGSDHAECNVHILRYLRKAAEEAKNSWPAQMTELLLEIHDEEKANGGQIPDADKRADYEKRYNAIIELGFEQNKLTKYPHAARQERALLRRLKKYGAAHLLFMIDPAVAFDNNMSERDLRGVKGKSKSCGGFRSSTGLDIICDVMSIVGTCKRRGMPILQTIRSIVQGPKDVFALAG